jgi:hypothetical protein
MVIKILYKLLNLVEEVKNLSFSHFEFFIWVDFIV